jgi:hypothetical protein
MEEDRPDHRSAEEEPTVDASRASEILATEPEATDDASTGEADAPAGAEREAVVAADLLLEEPDE